MITIYHKPQCSKSREGLQLLENLDLPFTMIKYLDAPLSKKELKELLKKLGIKPIALVRQKNDIWISEYKDKQLTGPQIVEAMVKHPNLIERPIVVNGDKAVIARPAQRINEIL